MRGLRVLAVAENQEQRAALEVVRGHIERKHLYGAVVRAAENELAKRGAAVRASVAAAADGAAAVDDGGAIDTGGAATVGGASYRGGYNDAGAFGSISILNLGRTTAAAASTKSSSSSSSSSSAASPLSLSAAVAAETAAAAVAAATSAAAAAGTAATETANQIQEMLEKNQGNFLRLVKMHPETSWQEYRWCLSKHATRRRKNLNLESLCSGIKEPEAEPNLK